jgi:hypothetical protein
MESRQGQRPTAPHHTERDAPRGKLTLPETGPRASSRRGCGGQLSDIIRLHLSETLSQRAATGIQARRGGTR